MAWKDIHLEEDGISRDGASNTVRSRSAWECIYVIVDQKETGNLIDRWNNANKHGPMMHNK